MSRKPSIKSKGRGVQHSRKYGSYTPLKLHYEPDSIENLKKAYRDLFAFVLARKIDPRSAGAACHALDGLVRLMVSPELTVALQDPLGENYKERYENTEKLLKEVFDELFQNYPDVHTRLLEKWKAEIMPKLTSG